MTGFLNTLCRPKILEEQSHSGETQLNENKAIWLPVPNYFQAQGRQAATHVAESIDYIMLARFYQTVFKGLFQKDS